MKKRGGDWGVERRFALEGGGSLTVREAGLRAVAAAERPADGRGLYKAYLVGPSGRALLGTLAPEAGRLRVRRTLSLDDLRRQGAWPPVGGAVELAFSFGRDPPPPGWGWREPAELTFGEGLLERMVSEGGQVLCRRSGAGFALAYPFSCARPFPLTGLFCLAALATMEGRRYVVYRFDEGGWPKLPGKGDGAGRGDGAGVC